MQIAGSCCSASTGSTPKTNRPDRPLRAPLSGAPPSPRLPLPQPAEPEANANPINVQGQPRLLTSHPMANATVRERPHYLARLWAELGRMGGEHDAFIKVIIVERVTKAIVLIALAIALL